MWRNGLAITRFDERHETWDVSKRHKTTRQEGENLFGCGLTTPSLFVLLSFIFLFFRKEFPLDFFLREALFQTAEPPEPLTFSAFRIHFIQTNLQRLTARRWGILFVPCIQWTTKKFVFICVHSWFQMNILYWTIGKQIYGIDFSVHLWRNSTARLAGHHSPPSVMNPQCPPLAGISRYRFGFRRASSAG